MKVIDDQEMSSTGDPWGDHELRVEALRLALDKTQHSASTTAETLDLAQQFYRFLTGIKDDA